MKNKKIVNLEWYNKIRKLIKEGENLIGEEKLKIIPEEERDLYSLWFFKRELTYNWEGIETLLFNKNTETKLAQKPKYKLPKGIKEFYEVDENGNLTGNYDWDYIIRVIESLVNVNGNELNIFEMWDAEYSDIIREIVDVMPDYVGCLLENINDPSELYERLVATHTGNANLDCPVQIRENASLMLSIFEECDWSDVESCWELLSDNLKQDKKFLEKLFKLDIIKENSSVLLKINPELYKDDDEFKMKMLECDCCILFKQLWDETKDLWDSVMAGIDDNDFFKSCDNIEDFDCIEIENRKFA